jgi:superfamily II DNA/RNA helicase
MKKEQEKTPQNDIKNFLDEHEINIQSMNGKIKDPMLNLENENISDFFLEKFKTSGFTKPSPIQAISWPNAISGRDLISIARTGSGKTLGYLLPMIIHIMNQPKLQV